MKLSQINNTNYNNLNFKSKIVPTKYIGDLIDAGIKDPKGYRSVVEGLHRILNDEKNNIIRIDYDKNKFWQLLFPGAYKININNKNTLKNVHFIGRGIEIQGQFALKEVYQDSFGNVNLPEINKEIDSLKALNVLKQRMRANQQAIFNEYDYGSGNQNKIRKIKKNIEFLKKKYNSLIQKELIALKEQIFIKN